MLINVCARDSIGGGGEVGGGRATSRTMHRLHLASGSQRSSEWSAKSQPTRVQVIK